MISDNFSGYTGCINVPIGYVFYLLYSNIGLLFLYTWYINVFLPTKESVKCKTMPKNTATLRLLTFTRLIPVKNFSFSSDLVSKLQ